MIKLNFDQVAIKKSEIIWLIATLFVFAVISVCLFSNYLYSANAQKTLYPSDFLGHLNFIKTIHSGKIFTIPHPGFHILVILFSWLSFTSMEVSMIIVLVFCVLSSFVITYFYLRSKFLFDHLESLLVSWILFLLGAIFVPFFSKTMYLGQGTPNIWHNPTFIAQKPLAILIFFVGIVFLQFNHKSLLDKKSLFLAFLLFASVWIKPNFAITFILSLFIYIFLSRQSRFKINRYGQALMVAIPSIISLALQYYFTYKPLAGQYRTSLIIDYLAVWKHYSPNPYISLLLGIAFPVVLIIFKFSTIKKNPLFALAVIFLVIALVQMAFFAEAGYRFFYWNFSWSYDMGLFFVFLVALIAYFSWMKSINKNKLLDIAKFLLCSLFLLLHLASGIIYLAKILSGFPYD
ncbi:MAG: hypothetical protein JXI33_07385 [Candidatus Aminicenantes bacterium]|nr:hypothetical protein [Candidatus Aminicenantes bacterium]